MKDFKLSKKTLEFLINMPGYFIEEVLEVKDTELHLLMCPVKGLTATCSFCNKKHSKGFHSFIIVKAEDKPISDRRVFLHIKKRKYRCPADNNKVHVELTPWLKLYSRFTNRFIKNMNRLTAITTNQEAGWFLGLDDEVVYRADKRYLEEQAHKLLTPTPRALNISIDEVSYRKYHKYLTNVIDVDKKLVIWNDKGRKSEILDRYYKSIGKDSKKIKSVALDGARTYISSTKRYAINALIVLDRFHLVQKLNNTVDSVRKKELQQARKENNNELINLTSSKQRFILLKNQKRLTENQSSRLKDLCDLNKNIFKAMLLKEEFLQIYSMKNDIKLIEEHLKSWVTHCENSGLEDFVSISKSFNSKMKYILNWFQRKISSAISEGFNNKIKRLKRMAYGYRDIDYFRLKIHQHCGLLNPRIAT